MQHVYDVYSLTSNAIHYSFTRKQIKPLLESNREDDEECLVPTQNPNLDPNAKSLSNISYNVVNLGIDDLYPPRELSKRNALSRTDGYWKFIESGNDPPMEFTYGEFDLDFFGELLDKSWEHYLSGSSLLLSNVSGEKTTPCSHGKQSIPWEDKVFCDIGSGTGRLVLTAAALHPNWKLCRGIELLNCIHHVSVRIADSCKISSGDSGEDEGTRYVLRIPQVDVNRTNFTELSEQSLTLSLAPLKFTCGSVLDPYQYLGDIDCAFVFSSCMQSSLIRDLSGAIGRQFKPGSIVITTESPLCLTGKIDKLADDATMPHGLYEIELLEKVDGWCWLTGGESTAYIHRVKKSMWHAYAGQRVKPDVSLEEEAFRLVNLMERGELTDTEAFVRNVYNEMMFHGISVNSFSWDREDFESQN